MTRAFTIMPVVDANGFLPGGFGGSHGFRPALLTALTDAGYSVTYVGDADTSPYNCVGSFNHNTDDFFFTRHDTSAGSFLGGRITTYTPDIVIMLFGQDAFRPGVMDAEPKARSWKMACAVRQVLNHKSDCLVILAKIPETIDGTTHSSAIATTNSELSSVLIPYEQGRGGYIALIDLGLTIPTDFWGSGSVGNEWDINNTSGYSKVVSAFNTAIVAALPSLPP